MSPQLPISQGQGQERLAQAVGKRRPQGDRGAKREHDHRSQDQRTRACSFRNSFRSRHSCNCARAMAKHAPASAFLRHAGPKREVAPIAAYSTASADKTVSS
eukprot:270718-Prymnesium_polylepis.1